MWKDIQSYEGIYQVNEAGKVQRIGTRSNQNKSWNIEPQELKPGNNGKGYVFVNLSKDNKQSRKYVHRLVLETFDPIENMDKLTVNHKDGNKKNNDLSNLEWATYSENNMHAYRELKRKTTRNNPKLSYVVEQLDIDGNVINTFPSYREAERQTGINSINQCCKGRRKTAGGYKWRYKQV